MEDSRQSIQLNIAGNHKGVELTIFDMGGNLVGLSVAKLNEAEVGAVIAALSAAIGRGTFTSVAIVLDDAEVVKDTSAERTTPLDVPSKSVS